MEKERQKAEKLAKFNAKKSKLAADKATATAAAGPAKEKKEKKEKPKAEPVAEYVEETPKGEKKSTFCCRTRFVAPSTNVLCRCSPQVPR